MRTKITHLELNLIEEYKTGKSLGYLYIKYGISPQVLERELKNLGLLREKKKTLKHKYILNYFEKIDSSDKAYWLGFLYADGYISSNRNLVSLSLQERDKDMVILFSKTIANEKPPRLRKWLKNEKTTLGYELNITSKEIRNDLISKGCSPNKSFTVNFPNKNQVPEELLPHFLRGYFDGDGSIMMKKRHGKEIGAKFCFISSIPFIENAAQFFKDLNLKMRIELKNKHSKPMMSLETCRKDNILFLYEYLYRDCGEFFLPRKKAKFEECVEKIKSKKPACWDKPATI